jgi:hypothetical protein
MLRSGRAVWSIASSKRRIGCSVEAAVAAGEIKSEALNFSRSSTSTWGGPWGWILSDETRLPAARLNPPPPEGCHGIQQ